MKKEANKDFIKDVEAVLKSILEQIKANPASIAMHLATINTFIGVKGIDSGLIAELNRIIAEAERTNQMKSMASAEIKAAQALSDEQKARLAKFYIEAEEDRKELTTINEAIDKSLEEAKKHYDSWVKASDQIQKEEAKAEFFKSFTNAKSEFDKGAGIIKKHETNRDKLIKEMTSMPEGSDKAVLAIMLKEEIKLITNEKRKAEPNLDIMTNLAKDYIEHSKSISLSLEQVKALGMVIQDSQPENLESELENFANKQLAAEAAKSNKTQWAEKGSEKAGEKRVRKKFDFDAVTLNGATKTQGFLENLQDERGKGQNNGRSK
jgi:hypothetical protein